MWPAHKNTRQCSYRCFNIPHPHQPSWSPRCTCFTICKHRLRPFHLSCLADVALMMCSRHYSSRASLYITVYKRQIMHCAVWSCTSVLIYQPSITCFSTRISKWQHDDCPEQHTRLQTARFHVGLLKKYRAHKCTKPNCGHAFDFPLCIKSHLSLILHVLQGIL